MPKRSTALPLMLPPRAPGTPAYRWLYTAVRADILEGRLQRGARLPSTRDLAGQYGLSRGTIVAALDQLKAEGYLAGAVGSGTYVSTVLPDELLQPAPLRGAPAPPPPRRRLPVSGYGRRVRPFPASEPRPIRAFRTNLPALDHFPVALWTQLTARRLRRATPSQLLDGEPLGYRPLREAVADYLRTSRGARCTTEQVAIVSGTQEALDVVLRLLVERGDRVCIENPGFVGASLAYAAAGLTVSAVPVDAEGMVVPTPRLRGVRLVYVTPAHQFPLGTTMSLPRRLALLDWARRSRALVFEDDYDSEFRYTGRPIPTLQGLDRHGQVLLAGSFSKVLFPALRLGYLVLPPSLVAPFETARSVTSRYAPVLDQAVLCDFITTGHLGRHIRRMRKIYAERLSILLENARRHLAGAVTISGVEAGLQTVGWLSPGCDAERVAARAAARDVEVTPLGRYHRGPMRRPGLHLGFAAMDRAEIERGVRALAAALDD